MALKTIIHDAVAQRSALTHSNVKDRGHKSVAGVAAVLLLTTFFSCAPAIEDLKDGRVQKALSFSKTSDAEYDKELLDFAAIPSISALPEHQQDIEAAASWLQLRLREAGAQNVRLMETGGPPVVYAELMTRDDLPTVLVYGHYDVQPVEPLELWETPAFQPEIRDGYFYGRGVDDDKGGLLPAIQAVEALLKTSGSLPINIKFLLEGEEEVGSPHLAAFLTTHKDLFRADAALSADAGQISATQPGIALGLRGLISVELELVSASTDMHSGSLGGSVVNPLHALAGLISSLHHPNGSVAVEGFYDDVEELDPDEREDFSRYPFDEEQMKATFGLLGFSGEEGYSILERRWVRPTVDVVGMHGGFTGHGLKTIVPSKSSAKVSCRLVPNQQPNDILHKVEQHILKHQPRYTNLTVTPMAGKGSPLKMPKALPATQAAATVLKEVMGTEPLYYREGGSIAALALFKDIMGLDTTMFGFTLGEKIHAPNERLLRSFYHLGRQAWIRLLGGDVLPQLLGSCNSTL